MSHIPTRERADRQNSQGWFSRSNEPESDRDTGSSDRATLSGPRRNSEQRNEVLGGHRVIEGVCRAEISPPKAPLGDVADETPYQLPAGHACDDRNSKQMTSVCAVASSSADSIGFSAYHGDHSSTSDIVLCEPPAAYSAMLELRLPSPIWRAGARSARRVATDRATEQEIRTAGAVSASGGERPARPMPELPPRGEIAGLGIRRTGGAPKRIGSGALVPAKLTWMPKDPFGAGVKEKPVSRFRWELMLTAASLTAVGGLVVVWLLKTVGA